ncbi:MAG: right-handed parallel beta-helix repeat-containing protein [Propionibacteriaceae bacterium]|jgi:hypothetical protein|nr:right-handed parallel beta-helix repeat-containing protein [Propionibacteriaceae bacterium]
MIIYVDASAARNGDGTEAHPFPTIQQAADIAQPGDQVLVCPGEYREQVQPRHAGRPDARIEYRSVEPLGAIISGAERLGGWVRGEANVWRASVPIGVFGDYNPYTTLVSGDWFVATMIAHTGDVYLNHRSMYEVTDPALLAQPVKSPLAWAPEESTLIWYAAPNQAGDAIDFSANFGDLDPNQECVEIAVRRNCFMPAENGIGYISLQGFTVRQAATQWAPPTAYQDGMVGPHWSKGWIIEDCELYESKCSGISLGKYLQPNNDNKWLHKKFKDGTQTERDAICQASYEGWDKEHIGSHLVRRCHIHDCGQTGIVGHLGAVFSVIEDNHIHHINNKQNLAGAEIGGIKLHAAIDVQIRRNHFHHCTRGLWLDWQAQGTRVTANLFHDNCLPFPIAERLVGLSESDEAVARSGLAGVIGEDIFVEVSHGPTLIDNNFLLSDRSLKLCTQGVAVIHNLIAGSLAAIGTGTDNGMGQLPSPRYTPYHVPHGTQVAGFMSFLHGDVRFYNNVFVGNAELDSIKQEFEDFSKGHRVPWDDNNFQVGTFPYSGYPDEASWRSQFEGYVGMGSSNPHHDRYYGHLPVWFGGNHYFNGARSADQEADAVIHDQPVTRPEVVESTGTDGQLDGSAAMPGWQLVTDLFDHLPLHTEATIATATLGMAFEPEQLFEDPDGRPYVFNRDYHGFPRQVHATAGPLEDGRSRGLREGWA